MLAHVVFVLAQYRATLTVGGRAEVSARATDGSALGGGTGPIFDATTQPNATIATSDRRWDHSLYYSPALTLRGDAAPGDNPQLFQTAAARTAWHTRHVRLSLSEWATYGSRNFGDLTTQVAPLAEGAPRPVVPLQLLPSAGTLHFGSTTTTLSSVVVPARRWLSTTNLSFGLSGGTDSASQLQLPVQRAERIDTTLAYAVTRRDAALTVVAPSAIDVPRAQCVVQPVPVPGTPTPLLLCDHSLRFLDVSEGWGHRWTRHTTSTLLAGVSARRVRLGLDERYATSVAPIFSVDLVHAIERALVTLNSRLGTIVDQRTALIDTRLDNTATVAWTHRGTTVRGTVQYSQSVPATAPTSIHALRTEAVVTRRLSTRFDVEGGARTTWQEQGGIAGLFTSTFAAVVFHEPRILF
jgi:hypothetical protein